MARVGFWLLPAVFICVVLVSAAKAQASQGAQPSQGAQSSQGTQTAFTCGVNCETQAGLCRNTCTITLSANSGTTSTATAMQINQCFIDCTRVQHVCRQGCSLLGR